MNLTWLHEPNGYAVVTLAAAGAVLAMAETDAPGPVQWQSRWIAEGGHAHSAVLAIDGDTARVLQGQNAGQGLLVVWAIADGIPSNELVLMLLGAAAGSASGGSARDEPVSSHDDRVYLNSTAALQIVASGLLSSVTRFAPIPIQAKTALPLIAKGVLRSFKAIKAKAKFRLIARQGTARPPSGLGMKMTILTDPYRPDMIVDQYLLIWFNGLPSECRVALKIDDGAEFQPAFTWQNPGVTQPAILKIDSAEMAGDGQRHRITVSVWQVIGHRTSTRATLSEYAKTPTHRPANQPAWCGATAIRRGETLRSTDGYNQVIGRVDDLTRIEWRHSGAVQIMAQVPVANEKTAGFHDSIISVGYADYDETQFFAEGIGINMGWRNGDFHDVLFGVAAIHGGQFGPITWANVHVPIKEILSTPTGQPLTPDEIAGTARTLDVAGLKEEIGRALFAENEWTYPTYWATGTPEAKRRDIVNTTLDKVLRKIKDLTRRGGRVTLDDLGRFEARWNEARTVRSVGWVASPGFIAGTRAGYILTDAQAKALNP